MGKQGGDRRARRRHPGKLRLAAFQHEISDFFSRYYHTVYAGITAGHSNIPPEAIPLYPGILLVTETNEHFLAELVGATTEFSGLSVVTHKETSSERYLSRFFDESTAPMVAIDTGYTVWKGIPIADAMDFEAVSRRFPAIKGIESRYRLVRRGGSGCLLRIGESVEVTLMTDCFLLHRRDNCYSVRNPKCLVIASKDTAPANLRKFLGGALDPTKSLDGISLVPAGQVQSRLVAGQLQSLFMIPRLRETTIGAFLRDHPEVLLGAFSSQELVYEPYCEWQCPALDPSEKAINPDLFLRRSDGFWDVYDLKTPLLDRSSLTKGESRRRRFIDYVAEGIAQLAHYRFYLSFEENRTHLRQKYDVVFGKPRFRLIVGFYENSVADQIVEAGRAIQEIEVIDYDSVVQLYLSSTHGQREMSD